MSSPSKAKGYRVEVLALNELQGLGMLNLTRTGSLAYTLDAADLVQPGPGDPVLLVATRDDGGPTLYTTNADGLRRLARDNLKVVPVVVQVKARKQSFIGRVWRGLRDAVA